MPSSWAYSQRRRAGRCGAMLQQFGGAAPPLLSADATRDLDELLAELVLTDLSTVEKRADATPRKAKSGDKKFAEEGEFLKRLHDHLNAGAPASTMVLCESEEAVLRELFLLTQ